MDDKLFEGEQIKSNRDKKIDDIFDEFDFDWKNKSYESWYLFLWWNWLWYD
jgi:hypothetical protein